MVTMSKTICPYPFLHSHIHPHGERSLCCWSDPVPELQNDDFWNNDYMKTVRQKMLDGEQVSECHRCYLQESTGSKSMRQDELENYAPEEFTKECNDDGSMNIVPEWFDYKTKTCNLQCQMCGPTHSSKHVKLWKDVWNFPVEQIPVQSKPVEQKRADEIIKSIDDRVCKRIYWAGGEPTMSNIHWKTMKHLLEVHKEDPEYAESIYVDYNTNMTHFEYGGINIADFLEPIQPTIRASIDGVGDVFEYIRDGGNWDEVEFNLRYYINKLNKKRQFTVDTILSAPVLMSLENYLDFFGQFDILLRNHRLHDFTKDAFFKQMSVGFLDLRLYPIPIVKRLVEKGKDLMSDSKIRGYERSLQILDSYLTERIERDEFFSDPELLGHIRYMTREQREPHNKSDHTIDKIMEKYDTECYEWFKGFK
jgi:sulfatase maturation enzyme AslB (radical SAM superfamily)